MSRGTRIRLAPGIYEDAKSGARTSRVTVGTVGSGTEQTREEAWPPGTLLKTMTAWQDINRGELRVLCPTVKPGTWEANCQTYLAQKKATFQNPRSYLERVRDLGEWDVLFRGRRRSSVRLKEVNDQLYEWRKTLSASTVNHRLDAISNLFRLFDGAHHTLVGAVRFGRPDQKARWIERARIARVLDTLSDGMTRARLRLLHWTGMRPSQLARLTPNCLAVTGPWPYILVGKGKGGRPVAMPLTPEGVAAAQEFVTANAWCRVQPDGSTKDWTTSANRLIADACEALELPPFTVYQIRHSFLRALRASGTDLADVQELAGHTDQRTTEIYAPVVQPKLLAAVMRLSAVKTKAAGKRKAG